MGIAPALLVESDCVGDSSLLSRRERLLADTGIATGKAKNRGSARRFPSIARQHAADHANAHACNLACVDGVRCSAEVQIPQRLRSLRI